jgi:hypothetical protein
MQPDKHTKIGITKNENEILRRIDVFSQKPEKLQAGRHLQEQNSQSQIICPAKWQGATISCGRLTSV